MINMTIDYKALLSKHGIEFNTKQQSEGNIGVNCPFCAQTTDPDPSQHLGINIRTGAWNCWRNSKHRGRKPHRLLKALCGLSYAEVDKLLGKRFSMPDDEFDALLSGDPFAVEVETPSKDSLSEKALDYLARFARITSELAEPHRNYLSWRGITAATASFEFGLLAGIVGRWAGRIIFPVFSSNGKYVVTWTSRSIGAATPRYMALSREHGANIKQTLYRLDRISKGGDTIVVTEGPMDAIVLQTLAPETAVTCTFGLSVSDSQIALLESANFRRVVFLFDSTAYGNAESCAHRAGGEAIDYLTLFNRAGDPGDLTEQDIPALRSVDIK